MNTWLNGTPSWDAMEFRNSVGTAVDVVIWAAKSCPDRRKTYANAVRGDGEADDVMDAVELPLPLLDPVELPLPLLDPVELPLPLLDPVELPLPLLDPVLVADCDGDVVAVPLVLALADCVADALADEEPLPVFVPEEENDDDAVAVAEREDDAVAVAEREDDAVAVADADELPELVPLAVPD
jgi:hypothetical protein